MNKNNTYIFLLLILSASVLFFNTLFIISINFLVIIYILINNSKGSKLKKDNHNFIEKVSKPIIFIDQLNCISNINTKFLEKLDSNLEEIKGKHIAEIFSNTFVLKFNNQTKLLKNNRSSKVFFEFNFDNEIIDLECELLTFYSENNEQQSAIIVNHQNSNDNYENEDLDKLIIQEYFSQLESSKAKIEEQAEEIKTARDEALEATKAKSTFLATMSHEIRTPLNGVIGMSSILKDSKLNDEQFELVDTIKICGETLLSLINDLLDFSKIEADKLELEPIPFAIKDLLNETSQVFKFTMDNKNINFKLLYDDKNLIFKGDTVRIKQILNNLISNAIKFTPTNGEVALSFKVINTKQNKSKIKFSVSDTGIGIPKESIEKIFKPFEQAESSTTRKFGGTGLGLSICVKLSHAMSGRMYVESEPGKGSTFHCELELENGTSNDLEEILENKKLKTNTSTNKESLNILLAEDNKVNQRLMELVLKKLGHKITIAENGEEAVNFYQKEKFDLILMDCEMPKLDGFQATEKIRELEKNLKSRIPIFAMTAHVFKGSRDRCIESGMDDYLSKPMKKEELIEKLNSV